MNQETRRQASLWLAVVFLLGGAIGTVLGYSLAHRTYAASKSMPMSEPERRAHRVADMTQFIGLTADQQQKTDSIIHSAHDEMRSIHDKADADTDAVRARAREQIRSFLTDEQKPKFDEFIQKSDAERKKQMQSQK